MIHVLQNEPLRAYGAFSRNVKVLLSGLVLCSLLSCTTIPDPEPSAAMILLDGEHMAYRSQAFQVTRPCDTPFPDRAGQDRYAYFLDGPGGHAEQLTPHKFLDARVFTENLGAVMEDSLWGFIDREGQYVISPQFARAEPFSEGLASVKVDGLYGYIDRNGEMAITPAFHNARFFAMGFAPVESQGRWHFIDREGQIAIPGEFDLAESFATCCGLAAVQIGSLWGFMDTLGTMVIAPQYEDVRAFTIHGNLPMAQVKTDHHWAWIRIPQRE